MPHPNRVSPTGDFIATPARGLVMGNRGVLHDAAGVIGPARWRHKNWVCCSLSFRGRDREILQPRRWTELFFLDECVALAAGHRPCAECRHAAYQAYVTAWTTHFGRRPAAAEMDKALHAARAMPGARQLRTHQADAATLPAGAMIAVGGVAHLVAGAQIQPFSSFGYGPPVDIPKGIVTVLTPAPNMAVLAAGYRPILHPTARF